MQRVLRINAESLVRDGERHRPRGGEHEKEQAHRHRADAAGGRRMSSGGRRRRRPPPEGGATTGATGSTGPLSQYGESTDADPALIAKALGPV